MAARRGGALARGGGDGWAQKLHGDEEVAFPGLIRAGEGRNDELDGELPAAATMAVAGGAQTDEGERERAEELQDAERKLARGLVGGEDERRRGSAWRWFDGKQRWAAALLNDGKKGSSALRSEGGEAKTKSASTRAEEEMELMAVS